MALRYRFTFVDICDAALPGAARRSSSVPALRASVKEDFELPGKKYVEGLAESPWGRSCITQMTLETVALCAASPQTSGGASSSWGGSVSPRTPPASPSGLESTGRRSMAPEPQQRRAEGAPSPAGPPDARAVADPPPGALASADAEPSGDTYDLGIGVFKTGSEAHPHLCARACAFFLRGSCSRGHGCQFCHGSHHATETKHLDKRHREILRNLPKDKFLGLIMPQVTEQIKALDDSAEMRGKLRGLEDALGIREGGSGPARLDRHERALLLGFRNRNLRFLLNTLLRAMGSSMPDVARATTDLFQQLLVVTARATAQ